MRRARASNGLAARPARFQHPRVNAEPSYLCMVAWARCWIVECAGHEMLGARSLEGHRAMAVSAAAAILPSQEALSQSAATQAITGTVEPG
jgi:hypothetical protein